MKNFKWGIIGPGKIAGKFAEDLKAVKRAELFAVASRTLPKAEEFAATFNIPHFYGSYEELVKNKEVDIIYIATPHVFHYEHTMLSLKHKKAVLCEKPFAMDAAQVEKMIATAEKENAFLMEALWTYFLPHYRYLLELVKSGKYGKIQKLEADFGFKAPFLPAKRLYNKSLGGGSLLDIGIYPAFAALSLLGQPDEIVASAIFCDTGVDESCKMEFKYKTGAIAQLSCSINETTPTTAVISFEFATVILKSRFHEPTTIEVTANGKKEEIIFKVSTRGYNYEAEHVQQMLLENRKESTVMTFEKSRQLIGILDTVRKKINLDYT